MKSSKFSVVAGEKNQKVSSIIDKASWLGLGLIFLCGLCCAAPIILGGVIGSSVITFLLTGSVAIGLIVLLVASLGGFFLARRQKIKSCGAKCESETACGCES